MLPGKIFLHESFLIFADVWGSAAVSGDEVKLSEMVLEWSASKPEVALSLFRRFVDLLEQDVAQSCASPVSSSSPITPHGELSDSSSNGVMTC